MTPLHEAALTLLLRGWTAERTAWGGVACLSGDLCVHLIAHGGEVAAYIDGCASKPTPGVPWHHAMRSALTQAGHPIDSLAGLDGLPERMLGARETAGLSRHAAAINAGVDYRTWRAVESRQRAPKPATVARLETWLDGYPSDDGMWDGPRLCDVVPEWVEAAVTLLDRGWVLARGYELDGVDWGLRAEYAGTACIIRISRHGLHRAMTFQSHRCLAHDWANAVRQTLRQLGPPGAEALASLDGYRDIGERLMVERERRGLSRYQAATQLGVCYDTVRQWEEGFWEPNADNTKRCERWLAEGEA